MAEGAKTIRAILDVTKPWLEKRGIDNPRLDAELLIGHALKLKRIQLYMDFERPLSDVELDAIRALVKRRGNHEPLAYITGEREFYGLPLLVDARVLVPRPDTETLVELALERLPDDVTGVVIDVCTGSGCVALALAHERPGLTVIGTDVSEDALDVARENAKRTGLEARVSFRAGDLLAPVHDVRGALLVVGNPPYIRRVDESSLMPDVRDHEPHLALFGDDDDGLGHHRRIVRDAPPLLAPHGAVLLEIGSDQGGWAPSLLAPPYTSVDVVRDLARHPRVVCLSLP